MATGPRPLLDRDAKVVAWIGTRSFCTIVLAGLSAPPPSPAAVERAWMFAGLTRYVATLLFNVGPFDVTAFVGMSAVMFAVALLASYIPALRASRVAPAVALRAE